MWYSMTVKRTYKYATARNNILYYIISFIYLNLFIYLKIYKIRIV